MRALKFKTKKINTNLQLLLWEATVTVIYNSSYKQTNQNPSWLPCDGFMNLSTNNLQTANINIIFLSYCVADFLILFSHFWVLEEWQNKNIKIKIHKRIFFLSFFYYARIYFYYIFRDDNNLFMFQFSSKEKLIFIVLKIFTFSYFLLVNFVCVFFFYLFYFVAWKFLKMFSFVDNFYFFSEFPSKTLLTRLKWPWHWSEIEHYCEGFMVEWTFFL